MVLCGRTEEGYTANINLLDGIVDGATRLGDGLRERVEIADDDGDRGDTLRL
jgi:hypothetical protein